MNLPPDPLKRAGCVFGFFIALALILGVFGV